MSNRRRSAGGGGHDGGQERWLLTYADMITLLLALFIVLFALSSIDAKKFDNLRRTLSQTFKGQVIEEPGQVVSGADSVLDPTVANQRTDRTSIKTTDEASDATSAAFREEQKELEEIVAKTADLKGKVNVESTQRGIVVSLAGDEFFAPGSADLTPSAQKSLRIVALNIKQFGHEVEIEGYTDAVPYGGPFIDNLGLSQARSASVFRLFHSLGVDYDKMRATGYGEGHPKVRPTQPRQSIEANRRIEIVILAPAADVGAHVERTSRDGGIDTPAGLGTPVTGLPKTPAPGGVKPITIVDDITAVSTS